MKVDQDISETCSKCSHQLRIQQQINLQSATTTTFPQLYHQPLCFHPNSPMDDPKLL